MFIRYDAVRGPLQPVYDGLFVVLKRNPIFFSIQTAPGSQTVSINRRIPAYMLQEGTEPNILQQSYPTATKHTNHFLKKKQ